MEVADDNFFIEEPQKLGNNFFNKNKSIQLVELLASKTRHSSSPISHHMSSKNSANNNTGSAISTRSSSKRSQQQQQQQQQHQQLYSPSTCRLSYAKKAQLLHNNSFSQPILLLPTPPHETNDSSNVTSDTTSSSLITTPTSKPTSFIDMLEVLCQAAYKSDDVGLAKQALNLIVCASNSGCCFLEKYLVMVLNFCTRPKYHKQQQQTDNDEQLIDETLKIKIDELSKRAMLVEFDRQQMTENLRRPDYKLNSVKQIVHLLEKVQSLLDFREHKAIDWLHVILDAYFVELATSDEADNILEQICTRIQSQCSLLKEVESNKSMLKSLYEYQQQCCNKLTDGSNRIITANVYRFGHRRPYYSIETIEI